MARSMHSAVGALSSMLMGDSMINASAKSTPR